MSKTCGECKNYDEDRHYCCLLKDSMKEDDDLACGSFESKLTNGDKIRLMSNEELTVTIDELAFKFSSRKAFLAWLNAPADCVKQNGKNDTQMDLCKVGKTESEGEDE